MQAVTLDIGAESELRAASYDTFIKYMGSKAKILDFVTSGIKEVYLGGPICDLFAGSSCLAGALRDQTPFISNDIQAYSSVLADFYLNAWQSSSFPTAEVILKKAQLYVDNVYLSEDLLYNSTDSLAAFNKLEIKNRNLIQKDFSHSHHLFLKYYSGTWWSAEQCLWIDALRKVADDYVRSPAYPLILCSLMHAVAYCSQGTGHFAQYRDAKTASSLKDILIYRQRSLANYFTRKYSLAMERLPKKPPCFEAIISNSDYVERLQDLPEDTTIYADPPYCFVHYSRFYHALETLVKYDYPKLQFKAEKLVKGRYREQRHQSPFCIKTQVASAFEKLFLGVIKNRSNLVLSYSNTGMISLEELSELANITLNGCYNVDLLTQNYQHMTMGRKNDRSRDVQECLILFSRK
jgi:adenine-specific DNA-methyltransferase